VLHGNIWHLNLVYLGRKIYKYVLCSENTFVCTVSLDFLMNLKRLIKMSLKMAVKCLAVASYTTMFTYLLKYLLHASESFLRS
jgi:hypothetical protein